MAQAIITRRDVRYTGVELDRPIIVPAYKKSRRYTGANKIDFNTTYYPLGDETAVCAKDGYLYIHASRLRSNDDGSASTGNNSTFSYEVHIGDNVYTRTSRPMRYDSTDTNSVIRFTEVFYIPEGATVSFYMTYTGTLYSSTYCAICSAE